MFSRLCRGFVNTASKQNASVELLSTSIGSQVSRPYALRVNRRWFNIHEYQGHALLKQYNVHVPAGGVASTPDEAFEVAKSLDTMDIVVKAQVQTGGRGKGTFDNGYKGGVQICNTPEEVRAVATKMLNHRLVTHQSGPEGKLCTKIFIARRHFIRREAYLAFLLDRASNGPVMVGSSNGGVDIEQTAAESPEKIFKIPLKITEPLSREDGLKMAHSLGFSHGTQDKAVEQMANLYELFKIKDATLIEINPFCETSDGEVVCVDAKLNFDDNALWRQPEIAELTDSSQEDPRDVAAAQHGLNFISLDGTIGCLGTLFH